MAFANPLSWWALFLAVVIAALVAWLAYRGLTGPPLRRWSLVGLRFCTLILLIAFLMRPVVSSPEPDTRSTVVPVLVDVSRSMGIEDADGARRIDRAREILTRSMLPSLSGRFEIQLFGFGDGLVSVTAEDLSATACQSDLPGALAALRDKYRGRPIPGIVLLSDGGDTAGTAAERAGEGPPVYAIGIGSPEVKRDSEILSVTAAEAVLDDSRLDLAVAAVSHGRGREPIEIRLLENGRVLEVRRIAPTAEGTPVHTVFQVSPGRGGPTVYSAEIPVAAGELVPENNTRSALVQPPARNRRVLLVEGAPGFEHSFLKRAWAADPGLEIDSVVRKGRNEQGRDTFYIQAAQSRSAPLREGYPVRSEDLFRYDAIVLANVDGQQLTRRQLDATRAFVGTRGGGLLVLGARSFAPPGLGDTPIEDVLPLSLQDRMGGVLPAASVRGANRLTLTPDGDTHPVMQLAPGLDETRKRWEAVPALAAIAPLGGPKPGAAVLALTSGPGGTPRALVAVQRFGEGRAMIFAGEAAWRWRMMLPAADRSYDTFWRQAVRWLALRATDPVAITVPDAAPARSVVPIVVTVRNSAYEPVRDAAVDVRVSSADGRLEQVRALPDPDASSSGRYIARIPTGDAGVYRIVTEVRQTDNRVETSSAALLVGGADLEMTDPRLNLQVLRRLAAASGGKVIPESDLLSLRGELEAGLQTAALSVRRDLWHNAWSFSVILLLLGAEWLLRRRWGMR